MNPDNTLQQKEPSFFYGWVIVASAFMVNVVGAPMNAVVVSFFIGPISDDLGVSRSAIAWALTFRIVVAGLTAPFLGPLIDRYGSRWLGTFAGVYTGATLMGLYFVDSIWSLYLMFALSGLMGFGAPGGSLLIAVPVAKWFVVRRGRAMAIATAGAPLGTVFGIFAAQALIHSIGWRGAWVVFGIGLWAVMVPLFAFFMRRTPEDMGLNPDGASSVPLSQSGANPTQGEVDWPLRKVLRAPVMWMLVLAFAMNQFVGSGTLVHRVSSFEADGLSDGLIGVGIAAEPLTFVAMALVFGMVIERAVPRFIGALGLTFMALAVLPMLFFVDGHNYFIFIHSFLWGAGAGAGMNFMNVVWPSYFGRKHLGSIRGFILPITIIAGGLGPPMYGYIIDSWGGYTVAWSVTLISMIGAGTLYLFAKPPKLRASRDSEVDGEGEGRAGESTLPG
jgi:MFS family permease